MSCTVKSGNERNPHHMLNNSYETAPVFGEEGADDVKSARLLHPGLHTCYKGKNKKLLKSDLEQILKNYLNSDCFLKLENMKVKSLVIVD